MVIFTEIREKYINLGEKLPKYWKYIVEMKV